jgi:hypothetical protein
MRWMALDEGAIELGRPIPSPEKWTLVVEYDGSRSDMK